MNHTVSIGLTLLLSACASTTAASPFHAGDALRCRIKGGEVAYPSTVIEPKGTSLSIKLADGKLEQVEATACERPPSDGRTLTGNPEPEGVSSFSSGSSVSCRWQRGSKFYDGKVTKVEGGRLFVDYEDGSKEAISPSFCKAK